MNTIEPFKDQNNQWRWRLRSPNGEIIANSAGDGFKTSSGLKKSLAACFNIGHEIKAGKTRAATCMLRTVKIEWPAKTRKK